MSIQKIVVQKSDEGKTLLGVIKEHLHVLLSQKAFSVKAIKRAIDAKKCRINGHVEFFSTHPVKAGDRIEIDLSPEEKRKEKLTLLFEDEELIAYNKPPGITSESFSSFYLVHRLDKETSGIFLLAKTEKMQEKMHLLFSKREVQKGYLAICDGQIKPELIEGQTWEIKNALGKIASYQGGALYGSVSSLKGKEAITSFTLLKRGKQASLVEARPYTGRTHQIRVHLSELGHPVLGDWQYAKRFICPYHSPRHLLHASTISFIHPVSQEKLSLFAPLWPDFIKAEEGLNLR